MAGRKKDSGIDQVVEVRDLSFAYLGTPTTALSDISFSVRRGEFFCIVGPNGAGKSSLCNALVGLVPHFFAGEMAGDILILGENTKDLSVAELALKIGLVFENPFNQLSYASLTVVEELAFGLGNMGVPRGEMERRITQVAELIGITDLLDKSPLHLSGGEVQRVAIGSVMVMEPDILVLDESTSQLDPIGSATIFGIAKDLNKRGITVIMVEHKIEEVAAYADRVLLLHEGRMALLGTAQEVFIDSRLHECGIRPPEYTALSAELARRGWWKGRLTVTAEEVEKIVRQILSYAD